MDEFVLRSLRVLSRAAWESGSLEMSKFSTAPYDFGTVRLRALEDRCIVTFGDLDLEAVWSSWIDTLFLALDCVAEGPLLPG